MTDVSFAAEISYLMCTSRYSANQQLATAVGKTLMEQLEGWEAKTPAWEGKRRMVVGTTVRPSKKAALDSFFEN